MTTADEKTNKPGAAASKDGDQKSEIPAEPPFAWYFSPRDNSNVFSLCRGHSYLATEGRYKYPPGRGSMPDLPEPNMCCVCIGTCDKKWLGKPAKAVES